jgi:deoxyhypusine synthase
MFNLVVHQHYCRVHHYRDLTPADEADLLRRKLNRVTDTCIPEEDAMRKVEKNCSKFGAARKGKAKGTSLTNFFSS